MRWKNVASVAWQGAQMFVCRLLSGHAHLRPLFAEAHREQICGRHKLRHRFDALRAIDDGADRLFELGRRARVHFTGRLLLRINLAHARCQHFAVELKCFKRREQVLLHKHTLDANARHVLLAGLELLCNVAAAGLDRGACSVKFRKRSQESERR